MSDSPTEQPLPSSWAGTRVQVHPGTGLVGRRGDLLLVVPVVQRAHHEGVRTLVEQWRRAAATGRPRLDELWSPADPHPAADLPGFALLVGSGHSLRAFVHGPVRILVDGRQPGRPGGAGAGAGRALAEHHLDDGTWQRVTVTAEGRTADGDTGPPDADLPLGLPLDLEAGTVPGGGVTLDRVPTGRRSAAAAEPGEAAQPGAAAEHRAAVFSSAPSSSTALRPALQFRTVLLGECALRAARGQGARGRRRPPLPVAGAPGGGAAGTGTTGPEVLVEGTVCPEGHFTDPEQPRCRTCGHPLLPGRRETRPRPPLGVVVTDGGTVYPVTGDFVIGREPERAPDVLAGRARPLPLRDSARSTSRVHAHLTVQGWQVLLSDDSSANGTLVSRHGAAGPWLPVTPRHPLALQHGDRVRLGKRQFLFDTWRETVVPRVPD